MQCMTAQNSVQVNEGPGEDSDERVQERLRIWGSSCKVRRTKRPGLKQISFFLVQLRHIGVFPDL